MTLRVARSVPLRLCEYPVASGDLYFAEMDRREVMLGRDNAGHIRIWGESEREGPPGKIALCQVFLEYALYCLSRCDEAEARCRMDDFGGQIGCGLAMYMRANPDVAESDDPTVHALRQIFEAMGADFEEEYLDSDVRFVISRCPVGEAARKSGLSYAELARHAFHAMCRRLVHEMNPGLFIMASPESQQDLVLTLRSAMPVE